MFPTMKPQANRSRAELAPQRDTAGPIYTPMSDERALGHIEAWGSDQAVDVRVDWDGRAASMSQFEVLAGPGAWQACKLIDTSGSNDVIAPHAELTGEVLWVRFQRGPQHRRCRFAVKAIPIVWLRPREDEAARVAERGIDYLYADSSTVQLIPWVYSALTDGTRRLAVDLAVGRDYEVWVRLQSPGHPHDWLVQEAVVCTGSGGDQPHDDVSGTHVPTGSGGGNPHFTSIPEPRTGDAPLDDVTGTHVPTGSGGGNPH